MSVTWGTITSALDSVWYTGCQSFTRTPNCGMATRDKWGHAPRGLSHNYEHERNSGTQGRDLGLLMEIQAIKHYCR